MDKFPQELHLIIFDYLDLDDLRAVRLVCKTFEKAVRDVRIKELSFLNEPLFSADLLDQLDQEWFGSNEAKARGRMLHCSSSFALSERFLTRKPFNIQFLKCLSIYSLDMATAIDFEDLNRFQNLECLEVPFDRNCKSFSRLSLPNLKALKIIDYFLKTPMVIVAPKLRFLKLPERPNFSDQCDKLSVTENRILTARGNAKIKLDFDIPGYKRPKNELRLSERAHTLRFEHPESVRCLTIVDSLLLGNYIDQFKNVEWLKLKFRFLEHCILDPILLKFPNLKRLDCKTWESFLREPILLKLIDYLGNAPDLEINCTDIRLSTDDPRLVNDYVRRSNVFLDKGLPTSYWDNRLKGQLALQLNHYSRLNDNVRSTRWICYNELVGLLEGLLGAVGPGEQAVRRGPAGLLPVDFFEKFPNIRGIRVTSRIDEDQFTSFVKNCRKLRELCLSDSQLGQTFFDELPAMSSLSSLEIQQTNELNMDFLLRMHRLKTLCTNKRLSSKLAVKMFRTEYGSYSRFKIKNDSVEIRRLSKDQFTIKYPTGSDFVKKEVNFKSLIEHCDYLEKGLLSYYCPLL